MQSRSHTYQIGETGLGFWQSDSPKRSPKQINKNKNLVTELLFLTDNIFKGCKILPGI